MCRACISVTARVALAIATGTMIIDFAPPAAAQQPGWSVVPQAMHSTISPNANGAISESNSYARSAVPNQRGPLARLVSNPGPHGGLPPYALTDQSGAIQRYVEPVPGVDLAPYVGQVVVVRHDTGRTLLASQLELPAQPLYPMVGERYSSQLARGEQRSDRFVQLAQYADSNDATVELLDDDEELPSGHAVMHPNPMPEGMVYPDAGYPDFPGNAMSPGNPGFGGPCCDPSQGDPAGMEWLPGEYGRAPCPQCGRYHGPAGYEQGVGDGMAVGHNQRQPMHVFADVEINFLRLHLMEDAVGKLSEKYEFSPRFIVGFTGIGPLDGRVRYWLYGRESHTLDDDEEDVRLEFDVLDVEATHHFAGQRSEVVLAAGLRLASIELADDDENDAGSDLVGITLAADGRTQLISLDAGRLACVYGGRLSILGGDWGGDDDHEFVDHRIRDDNVVAHELYAGLEFARRYRSLDLRARLAFEMQNWHSDVLSESADFESLSIVGPGVRVGAQF